MFAILSDFFEIILSEFQVIKSDIEREMHEAVLIIELQDFIKYVTSSELTTRKKIYFNFRNSVGFLCIEDNFILIS